MEKRIRIKPAHGNQSKIEIDDKDISPLLAGYVLVDTPRTGPRLRLDIALTTRTQALGVANVEIDPATAELLVSLGWQPPTTDNDERETTSHQDLARGNRVFIDGQGRTRVEPVEPQPREATE